MKFDWAGSCTTWPAIVASGEIAADRPDLDDPETRIWFDGVIRGPGDRMPIDAAVAGANQLGPQTYVGIWPSGSGKLPLQVVRFDTSCSASLNAEDQFGAIRVVGVRLTY